ncbi:SprT family zinc-dependent metalloprotease [Colwellia asteriadis]|uniref:SprT family zinc-dependent metalloprotease n=1 Tax=Colwellia asteriadis TaxID=517723 RepID=A0ABN1L337_9GAMM
MLEYQLIRSERRKTLGLQVKQGRIIVRAPSFVDEAFIKGFINKKSAWLQEKLLAQRENLSHQCHFVEGAKLYILGEQYTLTIAQAKRSDVSVVYNHAVINQESTSHKSTHHKNTELNYLQVNISHRIYNRLSNEAALARSVKKHIESYLSEQAKELMPARVKQLSEQTKLVPAQLNIRQYKARWGSCNSRKEISLNYLLMMAPWWVIDYVIIHELCHLVHLNHSNNFWRLVAKHCPEYLKAKQWLSEHQQALHWPTLK